MRVIRLACCEVHLPLLTARRRKPSHHICSRPFCTSWIRSPFCRVDTACSQLQSQRTVRLENNCCQRVPPIAKLFRDCGAYVAPVISPAAGWMAPSDRSSILTSKLSSSSSSAMQAKQAMTTGDDPSAITSTYMTVRRGARFDQYHQGLQGRTGKIAGSWPVQSAGQACVTSMAHRGRRWRFCFSLHFQLADTVIGFSAHARV